VKFGSSSVDFWTGIMRALDPFFSSREGRLSLTESFEDVLGTRIDGVDAVDAMVDGERC
jgi:hypothetical protein